MAEHPSGTPKEETVDFWKQKYMVLQGKYDAEVPRLHQQVDDLNEQLETLAESLASLKNSRPSAHDPNPSGDVNSAIEVLRSEYPDAYKGIIALIESSVTSRVEGAVSPIRSKVDSHVSETKEEKKRKFYSALGKAVSDWRAINTDPEFIEWLQVIDRFQTQSRYDQLKAAFDSFDAGRVAEFFDAYKVEKKKADPEVDDDDESFEPNTSSSRAPAIKPMSVDGKEITRAFIADFYRRAARGEFKSNPKKRLEIETKINEAIANRRVRK